MNYVEHTDPWWWGESHTFILCDGKAMVQLSVEHERPDLGCIQSLLVHESARRQGIGNELLRVAEEKAKTLGLEQVYLYCRKGGFLVDWYRRRGYEIYNEHPEYSQGQTVGLRKILSDGAEAEKQTGGS